MSTSSYYIFPDQVHFGFGVAQKTGAEAKAEGAQHALVIADPGVIAAGLIVSVVESLKSAGVAHSVYDKVIPNPDSPSVDAAVDAYHAANADLIIGIGGGSALDTAKAVRMVVAGPRGGKVAEYAYRMGDKARPHPKHLPTYFALPTTAGTGAEVTPWAVVTDPADKYKFGVGGPRSVPSMAIIDPELMMGLPAALTAGTGMDALTHLIEAYSSTNDNPALDAMILHGIELVARFLPEAVAKGSNRAAREAMANAAMMGGIAISSKWLGVCHSVAHQLSGFANVPHGLANAIMLPHVMRYNLPGTIEKYARVNAALGGSALGTTRQQAENAAVRVEQLNRDVNLPTRLRDVGVKDAHILPMAKFAYTVDLNWWTNPRSVNEAVMEQLYRAAL